MIKKQKNLSKKELINETHHEGGEFISLISVTPKKDGSYRLIVNLKDSKQYIEYNNFKMHGLQEILKLVTLLCKMALLDIKNAYYSIPSDESFQKYLKFHWKDKL